MGNLDIWNRVAKPEAQYLKKITGGRLSGKSDINPQWRYQTMTEQFGPCGVGWKFTVDRQWTEPGVENQVFAFVNVTLYVKVDGQWSDGIPGTGGHFLVEKETKGLHLNDEAWKMAQTDALGVAMKMLGVAAEIYLGNWDGAKYVSHPTEPRSTSAPAGKEAFGTAPSPAKVFKWASATSAERRTYTLTQIATAVAAPDPVQGMNKLREIGGKIRGADFAPDDMAAVAAALTQGEANINAECEPASGQ